MSDQFTAVREDEALFADGLADGRSQIRICGDETLDDRIFILTPAQADALALAISPRLRAVVAAVDAMLVEHAGYGDTDMLIDRVEDIDLARAALAGTSGKGDDNAPA